jgi:hypothetical protein
MPTSAGSMRSLKLQAPAENGFHDVPRSGRDAPTAEPQFSLRPRHSVTECRVHLRSGRQPFARAVLARSDRMTNSPNDCETPMRDGPRASGKEWVDVFATERNPASALTLFPEGSGAQGYACRRQSRASSDAWLKSASSWRGKPIRQTRSCCCSTWRKRGSRSQRTPRSSPAPVHPSSPERETAPANAKPADLLS